MRQIALSLVTHIQHQIAKALGHNHGKAVAPWLTPYGGVADMRGGEQANQSQYWSGACRSVRQCQPCLEAQLRSAIISSSPTGLVGLLPPNPVNQGITASPWIT